MQWTRRSSATIFLRLLGALQVTLSVWSLSVFSALSSARGHLVAHQRNQAARIVARAYIFVFRGAPLLVQLFVVYYGLSSFPAVRASIFWPFLRDAFCCATLSLRAVHGGLSERDLSRRARRRAGGAIEAARACGMSSFLLFRRVIFPIALRQALPAYSTEVISMTKATALVSLVRCGT